MSSTRRRNHPPRHWRRALVTGASSGIGEAFARKLAASGTDLVIVARREDRLRQIADQLRRDGVEVEVCVADLANTSQLKTVEDRLEDGHKPIDLLVNNAGGHFGPLETLAEGDRDVQTREALVNALAVLRLTHAAVNAMAKRRSGNVINVSAGVAFYPVPGSATYAASKAFVNSLTEAVNHELRGGGVAVTATCPGFTRTDAPKRLGFKEGQIPKSLWLDPEEVVESALAAARRGRSLSSPGLANQLGALVGYYLPRPIVLRLAARYAVSSAAGSTEVSEFEDENRKAS